jgi:hypothetical protein
VPALRLVVVSGEEYDGDPVFLEAKERLIDDLLRIGRRREMFEDVSADEDGVDFMLDR